LAVALLRTVDYSLSHIVTLIATTLLFIMRLHKNSRKSGIYTKISKKKNLSNGVYRPFGGVSFLFGVVHSD
jgi:hypothetical protein